MAPESTSPELEQMTAVSSILADAALGMVVDRARDVVSTEPGSQARDDAVELLAARLDSFDRASALVSEWMLRMRVRCLYGWQTEAEYGRRASQGGE